MDYIRINRNDHRNNFKRISSATSIARILSQSRVLQSFRILFRVYSVLSCSIRRPRCRICNQSINLAKPHTIPYLRPIQRSIDGAGLDNFLRISFVISSSSIITIIFTTLIIMYILISHFLEP